MNKQMHKMKRLSIITILFIFYSCSGKHSFAQNTIAKKHLEAPEVTKVSVRANFIDIYTNRGEKVVFDGIITGSGDEGDYEFQTSIEGNILYIELKNNRKSRWGNYRINKAKIDLKLPKNVELSIGNTSGDVYISNLAASKSIIKTTSGDVYLKNIFCNLSLSSTSGDIEVDGLTGDSRITSTSGDQEFKNIKGDFSFRATSGDLSISESEGNLNLKRTSGDVKIYKGKGSINSISTSGNIYSKGFKANKNCSFKATSGDISVYFTNDVAKMDFNLSATSGDLEVGSNSAEGNWKIQKGSQITINGTTTSGDQTYRNH